MSEQSHVQAEQEHYAMPEESPAGARHAQTLPQAAIFGINQARIGASTNISASTSAQTIFHQLTQSLTILSGTADMVLEHKALEQGTQSLRVWLQPNARLAEESLHRLRELKLAQTPAATELIQCLTVLVLAADMIAQGHLSNDYARESYDLLRRNADRAMKSLNELRSQLPSTPLA